jgi:AraC-like DNA-binding protein
MNTIEKRFPQEHDKTFIVYQEIGTYFPFPWHYHPEYELVLVRKSTGRRMVGDNIGYFGEGDLVFMGPLLPHVWTNDPVFINGEADYLADAIVVQFVDSFLGEYFMQIPEMEHFKKFLRLSYRGMEIKGKTRDRISVIMNDMLNMNGLQRVAQLIAIFDLLAGANEYSLLSSPSPVQNIPYRTARHFRDINEYIMNHFHEEISLAEISRVANMAVTTFCNFFKEHYRVTFIEYLNTIRVAHACRLLSEPDMKIVEVSYECGFNNLANFHKQFKKLKNMTPTDYRKSVIIKNARTEP